MGTCRCCNKECSPYFMCGGYCDDCYESKFTECEDCGKTISKSETLCSDCSWDRHKERIRNI